MLGAIRPERINSRDRSKKPWDEERISIQSSSAKNLGQGRYLKEFVTDT